MDGPYTQLGTELQESSPDGLPPGLTLETKCHCESGVTVAFFNKHACWFSSAGVTTRVRLRELLEPTEEVGILIAHLEARGVQFEIADSGELHFWVTDSARCQLRFFFSRSKQLSCCCRGLVCTKTKRNQWNPKLYS